MRKYLAALIAVVALLLAGTACTKTTSDTVSTDTSAANAAGSDGADESDESSDQPDIADEPDDAADDDSGSSGGGGGGDCPSQAEVDALDESMSGMDDLTSLNADDMAEAVDDALDQMASYLPADYDGDLETLREGLIALFQMYRDIDLNNPTPEQIAQIEATMAGIDQVEIEAAAERIQDYFTQNCPDIIFE
jgi:hypothetical protein